MPHDHLPSMKVGNLRFLIKYDTFDKKLQDSFKAKTPVSDWSSALTEGRERRL
jgi:hypothetical protein